MSRVLTQQVPEDKNCRLLVQGLVVVAALGGLDAGGTPLLAGTLLYQAEGGLPQLLHQLIALLGDADAAGVAVVDEDLGPPGIGVVGGGDPADVVPITQGEEGQEGNRSVLRRMETPPPGQPRPRRP